MDKAQHMARIRGTTLYGVVLIEGEFGYMIDTSNHMLTRTVPLPELKMLFSKGDTIAGKQGGRGIIMYYNATNNIIPRFPYRVCSDSEDFYIGEDDAISCRCVLSEIINKTLNMPLFVSPGVFTIEHD